MDYEQLPDGRWKKKATGPEFDAQKVRVWYVRKNNMCEALPLDVDAAISLLRLERDHGSADGFVAGFPRCALPPPVLAKDFNDWGDFEVAARAFIETAIAASLPPQDVVERSLWAPCAFRWPIPRLRGSPEWRYSLRRTRPDSEPLFDQDVIDALESELHRTREALNAYVQSPYYLSGPHKPDGGMAVCEIATGRIVHRLPGQIAVDVKHSTEE